MRKFVLAAAAVLLVAGGAAAQEAVPLYKDLGNHHHRISTQNRKAQQYFDQGLRLTYGFNHAEAIRSFRAAQVADPQCAMCFWGEALAFGPNINGAMDSASGVAALRAITRAQELARRATPKERAYIDALAQRYGADPLKGQAARDTQYARAMQALATRFDEDDAHVLHADAQMNLSPWDYYVNEVPKPNGAAALASLKRVVARSPYHAGGCHFYIHAVEAVAPEDAVPCAERLPDLMPGAGHIVHMPAHIYIRVGRYADAIDRNVHALHADEQHIADLAPDGAYRLGYYPHNSHFLWFAATMAGREQTAVEAALKTRELTNKEMMRAPGLGALQHYLVTPLYAYVRFGRWQDVLAEPAPPSDLPYPTGIWHYARALAHAAAGDATKAEAELKALKIQRENPALEGMTIWGLNAMRAVLDIAVEAASAEIALCKGDTATALQHLRKGVELEDALIYDEPPTWHLPVRHQLGAVLLAQGELAESEKVFREDLKRHPKNEWALKGLAKVLKLKR
jgi:tetratricopeptide (TPR) repeat protein